VSASQRTKLRAELPALLAELKRRAVLVARIWVHGAPLLRIVLGGVILWSAIWLATSLAVACWSLGVLLRCALQRHDWSGARQALGTLVGTLIGLGQAVFPLAFAPGSR
jgi:hypothetical protein